MSIIDNVPTDLYNIFSSIIPLIFFIIITGSLIILYIYRIKNKPEKEYIISTQIQERSRSPEVNTNQYKYCVKCGKQMLKNNKYCYNCGAVNRYGLN